MLNLYDTLKARGIMEHSKEISLLTFGGLGEIGMNLCAYKCKDEHGKNKYLVIDVGIGFDATLPAQNKIIVPKIDFLEKHRQDIIAIVITHAHDDHYAAIPILWHKLKVPIYLTPFPAELLMKKTDNPEIKAHINIVQQGIEVDLSPFKVRFINITHSVPESSALSIEAYGQRIVHTGDWKLDPDPVVGQVTDEKSLIELGDKGVLALVCDSTNILEYGGSAETRSEASIVKGLSKILAAEKGNRVFVTSFSSNLARMKTCFEVAKKYNRSLCIVGRSMMKVHEAAEAVSYWNPADHVLLDAEGANEPRGSILYICTGSQGEIGSSIEKIARDKHHCIRAEAGDVVIFSARSITGNEKAINAVSNNFAVKKVKTIFPDANHHIHVSGHPYKEDVARMYEMIRPELVIPVHGEAKHLLAHCDFARSKKLKTYYLESGVELALLPTGAKKIGTFPCGKQLSEGTELLDVDGRAIQERHKLASGLAMVTIYHNSVKVDTLGLQDNPGPLEKDLEAFVYDTMADLLERGHEQPSGLLYHQVVSNMVKAVQGWFKDKRNRKPVIRINIMKKLGTTRRRTNTEETSEDNRPIRPS